RILMKSSFMGDRARDRARALKSNIGCSDAGRGTLIIYGTRGFLKANMPFELCVQIQVFNSHRPSPSEFSLQTSASPAKPAGAADERLNGTTYSTATNSMRFSCGTGA